MRIIEIKLANFRGFARAQSINLDGDIVIVWGPNGTGKTSLLDACQWLVLGDIPRLKRTAIRPGEDYVSSTYADGPPSVSLTLERDERRLVLTRTGHGKKG